MWFHSRAYVQKSVFAHLTSSYANLLEQRKVFTCKNEFKSPRISLGHYRARVVSIFYSSKGGPSLETQGKSVGMGRTATTVFNNGRKSPWVPSLASLFPTGSVNASSWLGTKSLCIIIPNRRIATLDSLSWVLTREVKWSLEPDARIHFDQKSLFAPF